jgi:glyoxylase-like metal-dependent hydrolase (beta-lactamase superfamily II)
MTQGGKPHAIDKVLRDGDELAFGGHYAVAHLSPGHTRG